MCCDHDRMKVEGWQQEGEERWKEMKSGAWGGKQDVELVAQALTNQRRVRPQRRPGPGEGGSVVMELRCGRAQATWEHGQGRAGAKKGSVGSSMPARSRAGQGRGDSWRVSQIRVTWGQPGSLARSCVSPNKIVTTRYVEERREKGRCRRSWGKREGEFGRDRRRAS
jgi:hypothetical protein